VPESIPRKVVTTILNELGIDPASCLSLRLAHEGLYAEVFARDESGKKIVENDRLATHNVFIRFD
jgi:hypothetical protein